jgi:hypothetical protein
MNDKRIAVGPDELKRLICEEANAVSGKSDIAPSNIALIDAADGWTASFVKSGPDLTQPHVFAALTRRVQAKPPYTLPLISDAEPPPGRDRAEGESKVTVPTRFRGKGTLLVRGAEQSPVEYEITVFEVDTVRRTEGWVEAGLGVLTYAQSSSEAYLRLSDGRVVEVSVGSFTVKSNPSRAELIVHGGL